MWTECGQCLAICSGIGVRRRRLSANPSSVFYYISLLFSMPIISSKKNFGPTEVKKIVITFFFQGKFPSATIIIIIDLSWWSNNPASVAPCLYAKINQPKSQEVVDLMADLMLPCSGPGSTLLAYVFIHSYFI